MTCNVDVVEDVTRIVQGWCFLSRHIRLLDLFVGEVLLLETIRSLFKINLHKVRKGEARVEEKNDIERRVYEKKKAYYLCMRMVPIGRSRITYVI